jgi:hypothetical protein
MKKFLLIIFASLVIIPSLNRASAQVAEDFRFGVHAGAYIGANALTGGIYGTYGVDDWLNMEVGVNYLMKTYSFLDVYCDFQVLLEIMPFLHIYPLVGISLHDIDTPTRPLDQMNPLIAESGLTMLDGWTPGVNFGMGVSYDLSYRWRASGQVKMLSRLPQGVHKNSFVLLGGISYNF